MQSNQFAVPPPPIGAFSLFLIFTRIGLTSFGGGVSGWFLREFVHDRNWMSEADFLNGLAVSQALPGITVKNLAIWIGHRLAGWRGAAAGFLGIVVPPAIVVVILGMAIAAIGDSDWMHAALSGAAAAAIGLTCSLVATAVRNVPRRLLPALVVVATFVCIAIFQWPLVWVVLGAGTLSVSAELLRGDA